MKNLSTLIAAAFVVIMSTQIEARDTRHLFSLSDAMNTESAKEKLDGSVRFYFGNAGHPPVSKRFGEYMSNKKTNAFNKTDKFACEWSFLSAMLSFQQRAKDLRANAVINIKSYYKKNEIISSTEYECGAGGVIAGVTFKGEVVTIGKGGSVQASHGTTSSSSQSDELKTAQSLLALLGFDPGPADGNMGNKTKQAITEYQTQQGIPATGAFDTETRARMGIK